MNPLPQQVWITAQEHLRAMLSRDTYNLWFSSLRSKTQDENGIELEVANEFSEIWLKDNYLGLLEDVIARASGRKLQIKFKIAKEDAALTVSTVESPRPTGHLPPPLP